MKKLFLTLFVATTLVACDEAKTDKPVDAVDSTTTINPADEAKATDSSAMKANNDKMEAGKDSVKEADKVMDKAGDTMQEQPKKN